MNRIAAKKERYAVWAVVIIICAAAVVTILRFEPVLRPSMTSDCSTSVTTVSTGAFFPYSTQTTTYTPYGTVAVTRTMTAGGTVVENITRTTVSCG